MYLTGYRCMWVLAMFDLPTDTKKARKNYARFRKMLLEDGFTQMQYSVYARHCPSKENAEVHLARIERGLPPDGEVRVLTITDKQFERMKVFWGKMRRPLEPAPCQLQLF
jgi:CRISPR-associated protein Cas2